MLKQKLLAVALMAAVSTSALAFSLDSVTKVAAGGAAACTFAGSTATKEGLAKEQKKMQADTKQVSQQILGAQTQLAEALNLKQVAANVQAQLNTVKKGNINGDKLDKVKSTSKDADKAIQAELKKIDTLSAEQKKKVSASLDKYGSAALGTAKIAGKTALAGAATACMLRADPTKAASLSSQLDYIVDSAKTLPGFSKDLIKTGFSYIKLAKKYDIDVKGLEKNLNAAKNFKAEK